MMINIADLNSEDQDAIEQTAMILVAGFKQHHPVAWPDMEAALEEVGEALAPEKIVRIAVGEDGRVLGWVGAIPEYDGHAWELHPLAVHPDYQGQGVGRALVDDLESILAERGATTVFLGTDDENYQTSLGGVDLYPDVWEHVQKVKNLKRHAYEFYQKMGFVIVGVLPDANGPGKPDIMMAKRIKE